MRGPRNASATRGKASSDSVKTHGKVASKLAKMEVDSNIHYGGPKYYEEQAAKFEVGLPALLKLKSGIEPTLFGTIKTYVKANVVKSTTSLAALGRHVIQAMECEGLVDSESKLSVAVTMLHFSKWTVNGANLRAVYKSAVRNKMLKPHGNASYTLEQIQTVEGVANALIASKIKTKPRLVRSVALKVFALDNKKLPSRKTVSTMIRNMRTINGSTVKTITADRCKAELLINGTRWCTKFAPILRRDDTWLGHCDAYGIRRGYNNNALTLCGLRKNVVDDRSGTVGTWYPIVYSVNNGASFGVLCSIYILKAKFKYADTKVGEKRRLKDEAAKQAVAVDDAARDSGDNEGNDKDDDKEDDEGDDEGVKDDKGDDGENNDEKMVVEIMLPDVPADGQRKEVDDWPRYYIWTQGGNVTKKISKVIVKKVGPLIVEKFGHFKHKLMLMDNCKVQTGLDMCELWKEEAGGTQLITGLEDGTTHVQPLDNEPFGQHAVSSRSKTDDDVALAHLVGDSSVTYAEQVNFLRSRECEASALNSDRLRRAFENTGIAPFSSTTYMKHVVEMATGCNATMPDTNAQRVVNAAATVARGIFADAKTATINNKKKRHSLYVSQATCYDEEELRAAKKLAEEVKLEETKQARSSVVVEKEKSAGVIQEYLQSVCIISS